MLAATMATATIAGVCLAPNQAQADAENIEVSVHVITASSDNSGVPGNLQELQSRLQQQFSQFSGFALESHQEVPLDVGQSGTIHAPGDIVVSFEFLGEHEGNYRLRISLPGGSTNVSAPANGLFFVGGPDVPGGVLILAIRPN